MKWEKLSAIRLIEELKSGSITSEEISAYFLDKIKKVDRILNSFITLNEKAVEEAKKVDKNGRKGRLAGLPIAVKDNITTKGIRTTCASRILENYIPPYDAEVISRIKREGGIIIGKTNMDEFAMGSSGENSGFGPTKNPRDLNRVPGGSSSGSAAAIAAGLAPLALGSDTGGSIRAPASFTGIVGLKPTYGAVSRFGLIAYANSLEQIGPMGKNVLDTAYLYSIIYGEDEKDSTSLPSPPLSIERISDFEAKGVKVAVLTDLVSRVDEPVKKMFERGINYISEIGAEVNEVKLEGIDLALPAYYVIACSEASSNLARYDGVRFGVDCRTNLNWRDAYKEVRKLFGKEVKVRIMLGAYTLSAGFFEEYYVKAVKVRRRIRDGLKKLLKKYDYVAIPTMPVLPWRIGEKLDDPLYVYLSDALTVPANLAGVPAISLPIGLADGLPVGIQFIADEFEEEKLFGLAKRFEEKAGELEVVDL